MIILRTDYLDKINNALNFVPIVVLTGARQVGKTTLMRSLQIPGKQLFLNGQNPEIMELFARYSVIQNYLKTELDPAFNGTLFIDEFQYIPDISTMMKLLTDEHPGLKIICSGSSSLDIMGKVSESLAGRVRIIPVFSLSFREYVRFHDQELFEKFERYTLEDPVEIIDKRIPILMNSYLLTGGLPRLSLASKLDDRIDLLQDIYQTYLLKDIRSYIRNEEYVGFNKLLKLLAMQNGNLININSLSKEASLSYKKAEDFLYILEQMYIIRLLTPFVSNKRKEITRMKKVYFTDIGLRNIIINDFRELDFRSDKGAIFENFVYLEIAKEICRPENIFFYRSKDGLEVDFLVDTDAEKIPFEVKYQKFNKPQGISSLKKFFMIEPFRASYLVNPDFSGMMDTTIFIPGYFLSKAGIA
jgi:predicted AAA+ superfamily ATPase